MRIGKKKTIKIVCNQNSSFGQDEKIYRKETDIFIHFVQNRRIPIVAVVGKGNVGKSTLVNRLANVFENGSIVHNSFGITRDRTYRKAIWSGYQYLITDTGGFVFDQSKKDSFSDEVKNQSLIAIQEANLIVFLTDGQSEINFEDIELAKLLRLQKIPVILAVNKCENIKEFTSTRFWSLGLGEPIPISAIHGINTGKLLDEIISFLPKFSFINQSHSCSIAIIGRPNVGKSSILNFLCGKKKSIVSDISGTTRDSLESFVVSGTNLNVYNIIDTAGIRKKKMIKSETEYLMTNRTFKAIDKSDCVLIVIDATIGITEQDKILAEKINNQGKACVILFNKWDKIATDIKLTYEEIKELIFHSLPTLFWANILFISAIEGTRCDRILDYVDSAIEQYNRRISTSILNEVIQEAVKWKSLPPGKNKKQGKIYYCTQIDICPPTLAVFVNDPALFGDTYKKYIENQFRSALGFQGTCIKILWTRRKNTY